MVHKDACKFFCPKCHEAGETSSPKFTPDGDGTQQKKEATHLDSRTRQLLKQERGRALQNFPILIFRRKKFPQSTSMTPLRPSSFSSSAGKYADDGMWLLMFLGNSLEGKNLLFSLCIFPFQKQRCVQEDWVYGRCPASLLVFWTTFRISKVGTPALSISHQVRQSGLADVSAGRGMRRGVHVLSMFNYSGVYLVALSFTMKIRPGCG